MAATIIGYEGGPLGLVAVLLVLALGLAGTLLVAIRRGPDTVRPGAGTAGTGSLRAATGRTSFTRGDRHR